MLRQHIGTARGRSAAGAAALLLTTALLASCSSGAQGATTLDKDADVTLTWWTGQADRGPDASSTGSPRSSSRSTPTSRIDVSPGAPSTDDLLQKLSAGVRRRQLPGHLLRVRLVGERARGSERTLDITEQVADPAVAWDEFPEAARQTAQPTGDETIGFPAVVDNLSLIYNKTVFDEAGRRLPDRRLDLGRLPRRGQEAHRPVDQHLRLRLLGLRLRGDHLAVLAAPVAERRRDPDDDEHEADVRLATPASTP